MDQCSERKEGTLDNSPPRAQCIGQLCHCVHRTLRGNHNCPAKESSLGAELVSMRWTTAWAERGCKRPRSPLLLRAALQERPATPGCSPERWMCTVPELYRNCTGTVPNRTGTVPEPYGTVPELYRNRTRTVPELYRNCTEPYRKWGRLEKEGRLTKATRRGAGVGSKQAHVTVKTRAFHMAWALAENLWIRNR